MSREQQMYVIRESCPSPLGENELIDDFGIPFEPLGSATMIMHKSFQRNIMSGNNLNQSQMIVMNSAKIPQNQ